MLRIASLLAGAGVVLASCPNSCSGNGICSGNDICICYPNWEGPDCSLRTCAYGNSWAMDFEDPHSYQECSGAGLCDRVTGECKCFEGFTGSACQRRNCPNDCSGHGVCRMLYEIDSTIEYSRTNWDSDHIQACVCDPGYFGTDCSQRRCPSGDDPLTHCNSQVSGQVQELKVTLFSKFHENIFAVPPTDPQFYPEGMGFFGANKNFEVYRDDPRSAQLRVGFTDVDGATYFAPTAAKAVFSEDDASSGRSNAESSMELALENIAGMRVRNVKITAKNKEFALGEDFYLENRFLVTFVPHEPSSSNIGLQAPLWCDSAYSCNTAGCAPMVKMPFLYRYTKLDNSIPSIDGAAGSSNFVFVLDNVAPGDYVGLHANSSPYLAAGIKPSGVDTLADLPADIRILVAIQDPPNGSGDDGVDIYWTKVVYGEEVQHDTTGYTGTSKGPFSATNQNDFVGTLNGFTYRGFIPDSLSASIPDAPGIILDFSNVNMVTEDGEYNFYEILVKLPTCEVTPIIEDGILDNDGNPIPIVSENVENVECSNRGQCNRDTGLCECFAGYAGVACSRQSILV